MYVKGSEVPSQATAETPKRIDPYRKRMWIVAAVGLLALAALAVGLWLIIEKRGIASQKEKDKVTKAEELARLQKEEKQEEDAGPVTALDLSGIPLGGFQFVRSDASPAYQLQAGMVDGLNLSGCGLANFDNNRFGQQTLRFLVLDPGSVKTFTNNSLRLQGSANFTDFGVESFSNNEIIGVGKSLETQAVFLPPRSSLSFNNNSLRNYQVLMSGASGLLSAVGNRLLGCSVFIDNPKLGQFSIGKQQLNGLSFGRCAMAELRLHNTPENPISIQRLTVGNGVRKLSLQLASLDRLTLVSDTLLEFEMRGEFRLDRFPSSDSYLPSLTTLSVYSQASIGVCSYEKMPALSSVTDWNGTFSDNIPFKELTVFNSTIERHTFQGPNLEKLTFKSNSNMLTLQNSTLPSLQQLTVIDQRWPYFYFNSLPKVPLFNLSGVNYNYDVNLSNLVSCEQMVLNDPIPLHFRQDLNLLYFVPADSLLITNMKRVSSFSLSNSPQVSDLRFQNVVLAGAFQLYNTSIRSIATAPLNTITGLHLSRLPLEGRFVLSSNPAFTYVYLDTVNVTSVSLTNLTSLQLVSITSLPMLMNLVVSNCTLEYMTISSAYSLENSCSDVTISEVPNLRELSVRATFIGDLYLTNTSLSSLSQVSVSSMDYLRIRYDSGLRRIDQDELSQLSGITSLELQSITQLTALVLRNRSTMTNLDIFNCTALQELVLVEVGYPEYDPLTISYDTMASIRIVHFQRTASWAPFQSMPLLTNATIIGCTYNYAAFNNSVNLQSLVIKTSNIRTILLSKFSSLVELVLQEVGLTAIKLPDAPVLLSLDLSSNQITDEEALGKLRNTTVNPELRVLNLSNNSITDTEGVRAALSVEFPNAVITV